MQLSKVDEMIQEIGMPYAYYAFPENTKVKTPFVIFWYPSRNDFFADGENYAPITRLLIELYTDNKDFEKEEAVENVLRKYGMTFSKDEDWIESELMTRTTYSMEVIINAEN